MKALIKTQLVASAPDEDIATIEGNPYFPPSSVPDGTLSKSDTAYTCPWKGAAQYWDVTTPDGTFHDAAWSYPELYAGAEAKAGYAFAGFLAFDKRQVALEKG